MQLQIQVGFPSGRLYAASATVPGSCSLSPFSGLSPVMSCRIKLLPLPWGLLLLLTLQGHLQFHCLNVQEKSRQGIHYRKCMHLANKFQLCWLLNTCTVFSRVNAHGLLKFTNNRIIKNGGWALTQETTVNAIDRLPLHHFGGKREH